MIANHPLPADLPVPPAASGWSAAEERFLAAVESAQRAAVAEVLHRPRCGGRGLRAWLRLIADQGRPLPPTIPAQLVAVYLTDGDAVPLHDCGRCGLAVPVRPRWQDGHEPPPERIYFPACPHCGGPTGKYAYWAHADGDRN